MAPIRVAVPGGWWVDGERHRQVELRPLTGADEVFLREGRGGSFSERVSGLLARVIERLGPSAPSLEAVRSLTVGDREALLLYLRRLTLGERLHGVLRCPRPECGARMDLDLSVIDLLVGPYQDFRPEYEWCLETPRGAYRVAFRLPTGADQEAAAAAPDESSAVAVIFRRVVGTISRDGMPVETMPASVADRLSRRMAELDPQAELLLEPTCPGCGHAFATILDTALYFWDEMLARTPRLFQDVHLLASHYHWSERAILRLPRERRRAYVNLLGDHSSGRMAQ